MVFGASEFADNPEPRCPCLLLLDTSGSMEGPAIEELNNGLILFKHELCGDSLAMKRVEVAVVTFGPVRTLADFQTPDQFEAPRLEASGDTPMGMGGMLPPPPAGGGINPPSSADSPEDLAPALPTALQQQLGLRLESKKIPLPTVTVEKADKAPTEN